MVNDMPKVNIVYNLPDEQAEFNMHNRADSYWSVIWEFTQLVRNKTKYGDGRKVDWEIISDEWWNLLKDEGVDPYDEN
jgi:hypothetical protein